MVPKESKSIWDFHYYEEDDAKGYFDIVLPEYSDNCEDGTHWDPEYGLSMRKVNKKIPQIISFQEDGATW